MKHQLIEATIKHRGTGESMLEPLAGKLRRIIIEANIKGLDKATILSMPLPELINKAKKSKGLLHQVVDALLDGMSGDQDKHADDRAQNIAEAARAWDTAYVAPVGLSAGLPSDTRSFEAFHIQEQRPGQDQYPTLREARRAAEDWAVSNRTPLLTLAGGTGTGKTHLAMAAALVRLEAAAGVYRTEADLIAWVYAGIGAHDVEGRLYPFLEASWLVIDDLGSQALSPWGRGVEDRIIDHRWAKRLPLLVTTNFKKKDLPARIASRLGDVDRGVVVQIDAPDYRERERGE